MKEFTVAVYGLGNIGRYAIEAIEAAPDCRCLGVVRRRESLGKRPLDLRGLPDFPDMDGLVAAVGKPDVVIVCGPSRNVPKDIKALSDHGFNTVDSFDIHTEISGLVRTMGEVTAKNNTVSITAAGWDPGTDSVLRALFEAMAPSGTTFTNFGRGRSMGHSVAARSIRGVKDATSITIPVGGGRHSRLVYVLLEDGENFDDVRARIKADDYFAHDDLEVREVQSEMELALTADHSHGVLMERIGASGLTSNQHLTFDMRINNPALTAQILVSCARAAMRLEPGCYTLIDIPVVKLLAGEREAHIARLV